MSTAVLADESYQHTPSDLGSIVFLFRELYLPSLAEYIVD